MMKKKQVPQKKLKQITGGRPSGASLYTARFNPVKDIFAGIKNIFYY